MGQAAEIQQSLRQLYRTAGSVRLSSRPTPTYLRVLNWVAIAEQYAAAADALAAEAELSHIRPRMLLIGHALECSLKACLAAACLKTPRGHDLVNLTDLVLDAGYQLQQAQIAWVVHVDHVFNEDLRTSAKYKVRYPTETYESTGASLPPQSALTETVAALLHQARTRNEALNAAAWGRRSEAAGDA